MISLEIPGYGALALEHLVCDFSGTLSEDGRLLPGVGERIGILADRLEIHVLSADTHGHARQELDGLRCTTRLLSGADHTLQKLRHVELLGAERTAAIGNGNNDMGMLRAARLGIAVCLAEGCSCEALAAADILVRSPLDALDLFLHPKRLVATLRR